MTDTPQFQSLFRIAFAKRQHMHEDAIRLFDGQADGLHRLIIERFGETYRVRGGEELSEHKDAILSALREIAGEHAPIFWRLSHTCEGGPENDDGARIVTENGLKFAVKLQGNRNTGLFLDARLARAFVREHSQGRRVLNLFAYTCGFGVAAACGGAKSTVNVDAVPAVLKIGQSNYELNQLAYDGRTFWKNDVKAAIKKAKSQGAQYDAIILDPPPVLQGATRSSKVHRTNVQVDLNSLIQACLSVAAPGAWLLLCCAAWKLSDEELLREIQRDTGLSEPFFKMQSGDDFAASDAHDKLRAWAFWCPNTQSAAPTSESL